MPPGSPLKTIADVDREGVRIAVTARSAYGLWLDRNIKPATLMRTDTIDAAYDHFMPTSSRHWPACGRASSPIMRRQPGSVILPGNFPSVQQAIGTARKNTASAAWLRDFAEDAKASGLVAKLIAKHKVVGLSVAPKG